MTTATLHLRPFTPSDYPAYVELLNAARPNRHATIEEIREFDEQLADGETLERRLWLSEDELLGAVEYGTPRSNPIPGRLFLQLHLREQVQGDADRLYSSVLPEVLALQPEVLMAGAYEDRWELAFYQRQGFHEVDRMFSSTLDVTALDPTPFHLFRDKAQAAGVRVVRLAGLPFQDEDFQRRWYALMIELLADVPTSHALTPWPFELWRQRVVQSPQLLPEGYFFAAAGEELVGVSELRPSTRPATLQTGLTGVQRAWRRHGIAQALKLAAAEYAREQGYQFVRTSNHSVNRPMLSINEAMGYVKDSAWVNLERVL